MRSRVVGAVGERAIAATNGHEFTRIGPELIRVNSCPFLAFVFSRALQEGPLLELRVRLTKLLLSIHHDRAVPRHRLLERLSRDQQETASRPPRPVPLIHRHGRKARANGCRPLREATCPPIQPVLSAPRAARTRCRISRLPRRRTRRHDESSLSGGSFCDLEAPIHRGTSGRRRSRPLGLASPKSYRRRRERGGYRHRP